MESYYSNILKNNTDGISFKLEEFKIENYFYFNGIEEQRLHRYRYLYTTCSKSYQYLFEVSVSTMSIEVRMKHLAFGNFKVGIKTMDFNSYVNNRIIISLVITAFNTEYLTNKSKRVYFEFSDPKFNIENEFEQYFTEFIHAINYEKFLKIVFQLTGL